MTDSYDLLVIGGGINGAGIARDAAGRGLKVLLVEKDDLASHTSSASTKLVHGGLRYLETYEFRLVAEALREREVLLKAAPHIVWPLRFVLPHDKNLRPRWMLRLGLFLYDRIGGRRTLPGSRSVSLRKAPHCAILKDRLTHGFEYSDCWVEDSRMAVLAAMDARELGAEILTRTECVGLERTADGWIAAVREPDGQERVVEARAVVNAAGPWVDGIAGLALGRGTPARLRLVKGSHIIVPKFWQGANAYLVQNHDRRVIFINPYEGDKALIGTTDIAYEGRPEDVTADQSEIEYLLAAVNRYFKEKLRPQDVLHSFSGVRPLFDDGQGNPSAVTRDYVFDLDQTGGAPLMNIFGGKITTFRELAERGMHKLKDIFPQMGPDWTESAPLPGGEIANADYESFVQLLRELYPWAPRDLLLHYGRLYGARTRDVIGGAFGLDDLGRHFGGQFYEAEARYLVAREWARRPEDILRRRTKHYLHLTEDQQRAFADWFDTADLARAA